MPESEAEFQKHVIELLTPSRESIKKEYRPFDFLTLSVDIKSLYRQIEEWRELKILYYGASKRNIQNLWKGIGKVRLMQRLAQKYLANNEFPIINNLTLPQSDFSRLIKEFNLS